MALPASNRTMSAAASRLNLRRGQKRNASRKRPWKIGLKRIKGASKARNVILTEQDVRPRWPQRTRTAMNLACWSSSRRYRRPPQPMMKLQGEDFQASLSTRNTGKRNAAPDDAGISKGPPVRKAIPRRPVPIPEALAKRFAGQKGQLLSAQMRVLGQEEHITTIQGGRGGLKAHSHARHSNGDRCTPCGHLDRAPDQGQRADQGHRKRYTTTSVRDDREELPPRTSPTTPKRPGTPDAAGNVNNSSIPSSTRRPTTLTSAR